MASASAGPTPWAPSSASKHVALVAGWRTRRASAASSRTWWWTCTNTSAPTSPELSGGGGADLHAVADAADLDQHLAGGRAVEQRAPQRADHCVALRVAPHGMAASDAAARPGRGPGGTGRGPRHRRRRPGAAGSARPSRRLDHALHLRPWRRAPSPATASLTSFGEYWATAQPAATASAMASPLAWPTHMAVRTLTWKNTRSTATTLRLQLGDQRPQLGAAARPGAAGSGVGGRVRSTPDGDRPAAWPRRAASTHAVAAARTGPDRCRARTPVRR